jgi:hypothetical protein
VVKKGWIQTGLRVPPETYKVITLAAWFEGRSVQDLLFPLVEHFASEFAAGAHARAALKAREQYLAEKESRVVPLAPKNQSRAKHDQ